LPGSDFMGAIGGAKKELRIRRWTRQWQDSLDMVL
jgi:hypothetical protein